MSEIDIDMIASDLLRDAKLIGCASRDQLVRRLDWLVEAQENLARAIDKARKMERTA